MAQNKLIPVDIIALIEDQASTNPIVVLHDRQNNRLLPIWIGDPEARAIAIALNKVRMPRPLTHKLLLNLVDQLGAKISKIVVDKIKNNTYFATIHLLVNGKNIEVDSRPSDAIALALEGRIPIFVEKSVMDEGGQDNPLPGQSQIFKQEKKKVDLKEDELQKLKQLLEEARKREQKSSE